MALSKTFTGGERLFADDLNDNFEGLDTRLSSAEFDLSQAQTDLTNADNLASGTVASARLPAGTLASASSSALGSDSTVTSQSYTDTGMTLSYTPTSAGSRLYIMANVVFRLTGDTRERAWSEYRLLSDGSSARVVSALTETDGNNGRKYLYGTALLSIAEDAGSTDAREYKVQIKNNFSGQSTVTVAGSNIVVYEVRQ